MEESLTTRAAKSLLIIEPPSGISLKLRELWAFRELTWFLVLRAVKPRYRQTVLGVGWALIPPFMMMVVFSIFFNRVAGVKGAPGIPYPVFSYTGLLAWQYFAGAAGRGAGSLLGNAGFLTKVYFPRPLIPLSAVLSGLFDLAVSFLILFPLMAYYEIAPTWRIVFLPVLIVLATLAALAVSLWFSAASVKYRDLSLAIPIVISLWMFVTPVIYPVTVFRGGWGTLVAVLNPMASIVEGFRWSIISHGPAPSWQLVASAGTTLVTLLGGLLFFKRMERTYADEI